MQIVINIPKEYYEYCKAQEDAVEIQLAVKNGIPLPKYGKLIDYYDAVELINNKADEENSNFTIGDIEKFGALLREVKPIIEADRSEE